MTHDEIKRLIAEATPGPWRAEGPPWNRIIWSDGDNRVCFMAHSDGLNDTKDIATSELTAAAPDLAAQVVRLTEALAFYADPEIYKPHPHGLGFDRRDLSYVARATLEALK